MTGSKRGLSLFTDQEVCDIRKRVKKQTHQQIADYYKVSRSAISYIVNGKSYRDVVCK